MRRDRILKFFLVILLILLLIYLLIFLGGALSKRADADLNFIVSPFLRGLERLAPHSPDLKVPEKDIPFEPVSGNIITQNSFNGSSWFRIPMENLSLGIESLSLRPDEGGVLMIASPHITHVDCFVPKTFSSYEQYSYDRDSSNILEFLYTRYPVLWLPSLKGAPRDGYAYLNVRSDYPVAAKMCLLAPLSFIRFFFKSLITQFVFVGVMISFVVTYFLFYMMTGEKVYRTFMILQLSTTLLASSFNGHFHAYLKLPVPLTLFTTWSIFGLANIVGARFFLSELQGTPRIQKAYTPALCIQIALALGVLSAAISGHFFWVCIGATLAFFLSLAGSVLLLIQVVRTSPPLHSLLLHIGSHTVFFLGLGIMFLGTYYTPYYLDKLSYPDTLYMVLLATAPFLSILRKLFESRARFNNYNLLQAQNTLYRELSQRDGLTGLYNRSYLEQTLIESVMHAEKTEKNLSFIMLDIDHFKNFNDTWGHQEGDRALAFVARIIRDSLREQDIAARYGGEEFSIVLAGADLLIANIVAERIRRSCEVRSLSLGKYKTLTVSLGISLFRPGETPECMIRRADEALYRAKRNGRNRAEVEVEAEAEAKPSQPSHAPRKPSLSPSADEGSSSPAREKGPEK